MFRNIETTLGKWRTGGMEEPLVIEGVHGCGKTYILERFAEGNFRQWIRFDMGEHSLADAVSTCNPARLVSELGRISGRPVTRDCLLIFDNLERHPEALDALQGLASSGLCAGIACACARVGRIDGAVRMDPMSFDEFLLACGESELRAALEEPLSDAVSRNHGRLLSRLREYLAVGGLPAAVSTWISTGDGRMVDLEISRVLDGIRDDAMLSMAGASDTIWSVISSIPGQLSGRNRKFMFGRAVPGARSKTLFESIRWLEDCGVVGKLQISDRMREPLDSVSEPPNFKLYAFDTGALRVLSGMPVEVILSGSRFGKDFMAGFTENYAFLEMLRSGMTEMFCWRSGNKAEVAFVFRSGDDIVPLQLNVGGMAFTRSLTEFRRRYETRRALYMSPLAPDGTSDPLRIPVYAAGYLDRALDDLE